MNIKELTVDDAIKNMLRPLTDEEREKLEQDILVHGVIDPIVVWNNIILDGHNRYDICIRHGILDVDVKPLLFAKKSDAMQWVDDHQKGRRNLKESDRMRSAMEIEKQLSKEARERQAAGGGDRKSEEYKKSVMAISTEAISKPNQPVSDIMAQKLGIGRHKYEDQKLIMVHGTPEQISRMDNGVAPRTIAKEIREENEPKKKCSICGKMLPISHFNKNRARVDGYEWRCKECRAKSRTNLVDPSGKILMAIEQVKDSETDRMQTFEEALESLKSIIDNFINAFSIQVRETQIDTEEKRNAINTLIDGIKPRLFEGEIKHETL